MLGQNQPCFSFLISTYTVASDLLSIPRINEPSPDLAQQHKNNASEFYKNGLYSKAVEGYLLAIQCASFDDGERGGGVKMIQYGMQYAISDIIVGCGGGIHIK